MKPFLDEDFLLDTAVAQTLYHRYAAGEPVLDYHCHIDPQAIYEDLRYGNIAQVWLGGDHYKWRLMRAAGVPERCITGDAPDREKFQRWAETLASAIGNPVYHWSHLELRRYFGYKGVLNADTAEAVWTLCNAWLAAPGFSVRGLIARSNVSLLCTTDDPIDPLLWHERLADDPSFSCTVLPAWRPDRAKAIESPDYLAYLQRLSAVSGIRIESFAALEQALAIRMDFFHDHGCRLSDHALAYVMHAPYTDAEIETIFARRIAGFALSRHEVLQFETAFMRSCARAYHARGWAMQLHYGCKRDVNARMYGLLGPDTGFDCIDNHTPSSQLADFLNSLGDALPRTIVYSLNPNDDAAISTVIGCFQGEDAVCRMQHGSAWWFNDHIGGMERQITSLANTGYLAGFIGMLTDSRSFLSYPRHEYFRRILCRVLGRWVEEGQFPNDLPTLGTIVQNIAYRNAVRYFRFPEKKG